MTDVNNLGRNIAEMRKEIGLTQKQLAQLIGVTAQAVSKWETNDSLPDIALLPKIAEVFGTTIDSLLSLSEDVISASRDAMNEVLEGIHALLKKNGGGSAIILNDVSGCKISPASSALDFKGRSLFNNPDFLLFVSDEYLAESNTLDSNAGIRKTREQLSSEFQVSREIVDSVIADSKELLLLKEDRQGHISLTLSGIVMVTGFLAFASCFHSLLT
jgi:transcriptional regulator with XRE-family HTH domain